MIFTLESFSASRVAPLMESQTPKAKDECERGRKSARISHWEAVADFRRSRGLYIAVAARVSR